MSTDKSVAIETPNQIKRTTANVKSETVVTYHPIATQIGYDILRDGGNAFDAFVGATAAEYVLGEGVTSLAGPLGALLYDSKRKTAIYLDAGFNTPIDPAQKWDPQNPLPGTSALVPGAVAGLEAISKKYGRLSFNKTLQPAIHLAENGFPLNAEYAGLIRAPEYSKNLIQNAYGLRTFFKDGQPLSEGDILKLPEVAHFLRQVARHGGKYVYTGAWAQKARIAVNEAGGHLLAKDFSTYKAEWKSPWRISYRGYDIFSPQNNGGLNTLLALKVLENTDITKFGVHYSQSPEALETLGRIQSAVASEPWLHDQAQVDNSQFVASMFAPAHVDQIWEQVQAKLPLKTAPNSGSHSYHIVVIDKDGNAVTGTNTIESFPWGKGIFVEGIPLTASGALPFDTKPGQRRKSVFTMQIGLKSEKLRFASGAFSASMIPAEFQFLVNIIDFKLPAKDAVSFPRFGDRAFEMPSMKPSNGFWLDPRIDKSVIGNMEKQGINFIQDGYIDTGLGSVAVVLEDGTVEGAFAPLSSIGFHGPKAFGIGASLDFSKDQKLIITKVIEGSPAAKYGLRAGDIINKIQHDPYSSFVSVDGLKMEQVLTLMRGERNMPVKLVVLKITGETITVELIRDEIKKRN